VANREILSKFAELVPYDEFKFRTPEFFEGANRAFHFIAPTNPDLSSTKP
jgi:hypothetical protein